MDAIDRKILALLQEDGRLTVTELARIVTLSVSACHRRVRELEQLGAIERYRAEVSPGAVGLDFEAIVFVTMGRSDVATVSAFEEAVDALPNVVQAERLFGQPDYLLRVLAANLASYQQLYDDALGSLPGVQRLSSTLVMKRIRAQGVVPLTL
jgi:DNA-binding Lrp family transcriptional regulator